MVPTSRENLPQPRDGMLSQENGRWCLYCDKMPETDTLKVRQGWCGPMVPMTGSTAGAELRQITTAGEYVAEATAVLTAARKATSGPVSVVHLVCPTTSSQAPLPVFHHVSPFSYLALLVDEQGRTGEQACRRHCRSKP